jgi:hypothetical protein
MSTWTKVLTAADITALGSGQIITGAERTKLTNIETSADVTDAANVAAAGAVMNTGNETIGGTKTFSSTIGGSINGNAATVTNGVYTSSSVTVLSDVTSVGSGAIITSTERTKLTGIADAANNYVHPNHTGDVTSTADGATIIGTDKVITSMILDDNVTAAKLADSINTDIATGVAALPKAGGTMSGAIAMGTSKITGLGDPTLAQDAATKTYVDSAVSGATDNNVNTANLLARLAQLDNGGDIIIGNAANTTVKIAGNLQVTGTTETINATELKVDDLTIAVASGSASAANANNSGLEVDIDADNAYTTNPAILFQSTHTSFSQFKMRKGVTGEDDAFIAAMTTAANTTALDALTPGIGTFAMVSGALYIQTA